MVDDTRFGGCSVNSGTRISPAGGRATGAARTGAGRSLSAGFLAPPTP